MTPDPALFLSTVIVTSAALVAIIGGLLVARFVRPDSDRRSTRMVLIDTDGRFCSACRRVEEPERILLR